MVDLAAVHDHVAVPGGSPRHAVAFDDDGAAAIGHWIAIAVEVRTVDGVGSPDGHAIGQVVDRSALSRAAQSPAHEQVVVAAAVEEDGRLDLRGPGDVDELSVRWAAACIELRQHDAIPE